MCGRFAFYAPAEAVRATFGAEVPAEIEPRYNIPPTAWVPVIREDEERTRRVAMLYWGLVPFWAKDRKIGNRMINARAETLAEKPAFRQALARRRCLVLASGFYEWQRAPDGKQPWYVTRRDGAPLAFAGLWEHWDGKGAEPPLESCTIVTTAANEVMQPIHQRMPAILGPGDVDAWLDPAGREPAALAAIPAPCPSDWLELRPVSRRVNSPANDDERLIERVD